MPPTAWSPRRRELTSISPSSSFSAPHLFSAVRSSQIRLLSNPLSTALSLPLSHPISPQTPIFTLLPPAQSERIILRRHLPHEIFPHHRQLLHDIRPYLGHIGEELHREDARHDAEACGRGAEFHGAPEIDAADVGEDFVAVMVTALELLLQVSGREKIRERTVMGERFGGERTRVHRGIDRCCSWALLWQSRCRGVLVPET